MVKIRQLGRVLLGLAVLFTVSSTPASADLGDKLDRATWSVVKVSSSHYDSNIYSGKTLDNAKDAIIDSDVSTYWHSNWSSSTADATNGAYGTGCSLPEYFVIDLGQEVSNIAGFGYQPRKYIDGTSSKISNGAATAWTIYLLSESEYNALTISDATDATSAHATLPSIDNGISGAFTYDDTYSSTDDITEKQYQFVDDSNNASPKSARYVIFSITASSKSPRNDLANCAEFYLYNYVSSSATVTYKVLDSNGNTVASQEVTQGVGTAASLPTNLKRDFCTYSDLSVSTIEEGTTEVTTTVTYSLPFTATSYTTTDAITLDAAKWHTVGIRYSYRYLNFNESNNATSITGENFSTYQLPTTANLFAFTGNPYTGFRIYAYGAGADKAYYHTLQTTYSANQTDVAMTATSTDNFDTGGTWDLHQHGTQYYFLLHGSTNGYFHDLPAGIQIWASGNAASDAGSMLTFTEVTLDDIARCAEATTAINNSDASNTTTCVTAASTYLGTTTTAPSIDDAFNAFKASMTAENLTALKTATNGFAEARAKLETELADKYYTLKNPSGAYLSLKDGVGSTSAFGNIVTTVTPNELWQFTPCENGFKLKHANLGAYLNAVATGSSSTTGITSDYSGGGKYLLEPTNGYTYVHNSGSFGLSYESSSGNLGNINGWYNESSTSNNASWTIAKVESIELALNTVGEASYATTYLPFGVSKVENATPYFGTYNSEAKTLTANETGGTIPANQGVILVGTSDTATLTIGEATADGSSNDLLGTCVNLTNDKYLTFGRRNDDDNVVGFFLYTGETISANKAYLKSKSSASDEESNAVRLVFGGESTGIDAATIFEDGVSNAPIYDLSGRRVTKPVKGGVYLQGGRKFIK